MTETTTARVYVGTYGKYAAGSIAGKWLDLGDYNSREEFYEACAELHKDEEDPEIMFQDYEGIPKGKITESHIDADMWELLQLDEWKQDVVRAFWSEIDADADIERAMLAFYAEFESEADFAENFAIEAGYVKEADNNPVLRYVDWQRYWDAELRFDFVSAAAPFGNKFIFRSDY